MKAKYKLLTLLFIGCLASVFAYAQPVIRINSETKTDKEITVGAARMDKYLKLLSGKDVAIVANQSSIVGDVHLVDTLIASGVKVVKIFTPEHGFRGTADAGEHIKDSRDSRTGLPVISLYGNHKKPKESELKDVDIVVFDIQDVGVRFYTYVSTMHYVMEACAENNKAFLVLDRPNPNGHYVDGPVLEEKHKSFVGMHRVPLVHGMTLAEFARMINNEGWLKNGLKCELKYIPCENYAHNDYYRLPVKPSPNLPNMRAVYLYPSLGLFEGTVVSVGRGTDKPFQVIGHPDLKDGNFKFTPISMAGASNPPFKGIECAGFDLSEFAEIYVRNIRRINLFWLIGTYQKSPDKGNFFNSYFNRLAGTDTLKDQIIKGMSEEEIRKSWQQDITEFKQIRKKYLLYRDFE